MYLLLPLALGGVDALLLRGGDLLLSHRLVLALGGELLALRLGTLLA